MVMYAEVRKDGVWHKVGKEFVSTYAEMEGQLTDRVFDGRNKTLEEFLMKNNFYTNYIPNNASEEIKNSVHFDGVVHWVTLKYLLDLDWDQEIYDTGYISDWQHKRLKEHDINPVSILREHRAKDRKVVSPFMMDMIIAHPALRNDSFGYYVTYVYNKRTIKKECEFFCYVSIPKLIELIPEGGTTDDVRIIFNI